MPGSLQRLVERSRCAAGEREGWASHGRMLWLFVLSVFSPTLAERGPALAEPAINIKH
jgi:hypothetical protein